MDPGGDKTVRGRKSSTSGGKPRVSADVSLPDPSARRPSLGLRSKYTKSASRERSNSLTGSSVVRFDPRVLQANDNLAPAVLDNGDGAAQADAHQPLGTAKGLRDDSRLVDHAGSFIDNSALYDSDEPPPTAAQLAAAARRDAWKTWLESTPVELFTMTITVLALFLADFTQLVVPKRCARARAHKRRATPGLRRRGLWRPPSPSWSSVLAAHNGARTLHKVALGGG